MSKYRTARSLFRHYKARVLVVSLALCVAYVVSAFAGAEERLIHVFPISVAGEGWEREQHALEQVLGDRAVFEDFNRQNAAFVIFPEGDSDLMPDPSSSDMLVQPQGAWGDAPEPASEETTDAPAADNANESQDEIVPMPDTTPSAFLFDALRGLAARPAHAEEGDTQANEPVETIEPASDEVSQEIPADLIEQVDEGTEAMSGEAPVETHVEPSEEGVAHEDAQEPEDSPLQRSSEEDMRSCTVLGKRCHTIMFEGFDIGSILSEHDIEGYTLRLSVAARTLGESFTPDSLMVRYYYRGEWRIAGQAYLDRELSNATEGGHLSFPLPDLDSWDALQDLKVEVEVVRNGTARTEVFLDSVWVDTRYEVTSADEEVPMARNIVEELAIMEDSARPDVLLVGNERIEMVRDMNMVGDDLVIRSDLNVYNGLTTARSYIAVTNTTDRSEDVRLLVRTGPQAQVTGLQERVEDMQVSGTKSTFSDVAYFCEAGWSLGDIGPRSLLTEEAEISAESDINASSSLEGTEESVIGTGVTEDETASTTTSEPSDDTSTTSLEVDPVEVPDASLDLEPTIGAYECKATGEVRPCSSFNADKTNCIVGSERVSVEEELRYETGWRTVGMRDMEDEGSRSGILARFFGTRERARTSPLTQARETDETFVIAPKETKYFAIDLSFEAQRAGEFAVEVHGEDGDTSKTMWWRSAYAYRMPVVFSPGEVVESEVPTLYRVTFDHRYADLFSEAALDGADVRFYDPSTRSEVPAREVAYSYVDQEAEYLIEPRDRVRSTTTLYAYFGNEHVSKDARALAPALAAEPIPYARLSKPEDGAVLSFTTEYRGSAFTAGTDGGVVTLEPKMARDVFVEGDGEIRSRGPVRVRLSEGEIAAGVRSFELAPEEHTVVSRSSGSSGEVEYELVRYREAAAPYTIGARETLPLPAVGLFEAIPARDPLTMTRYLRNLQGPALHDFREPLRDFTPGEHVGFALNYRAQRGKVSRFLRGFFAERLANVSDVRLLREGTSIEDAVFEVTYGTEGEWTIDLVEAPREFVPGKYTVAITVDETGTVYTDSFEFYWGVLVVNTPRSIYGIDDLVELHMAALDDKGDTICDAELRLTVIAPSGVAEELRVDPQSTCGPNNVTDSPDYLAWYRPQETGRHDLMVTQVDADGGVVHQVKDSFEVREDPSYVVERRGATRIWPKASYGMEFSVTALSDFKGELAEAVPEDFDVVAEGAEVTMWGGAKRVVWPVELRAGETKTFRYEYDAPDISPYIYLLGPAELRVEGKTAFKEARTWKLASDALGQYVERFTTITPTVADTWTTIDLSGAPYNIPANAVVEMALINTDYGNELYAGVRHSSSTLDRRFLLHEAETTGTGVEGMTTVTVHVTASATSAIQYYADDTTLVSFRILGYWTSGVYVERFDTVDPSTTDDAWVNWDLNTFGLTQGDVAEMVLAVRTNNTSYYAGIRTDGSTLDRRVYINEEESGGGNYATMLVVATTSTARVESYSDDDGGGTGSAVDFMLAGYWDSLPTGLTYNERWDNLGGPTSNTTWTDRRLDNVSVPPSGIAEILFGNSADANGAMEVGVRTNGSSLGRVLDLHEAETTANDYNFGRAHVTAGSDASSTIEYYTENTTFDLFRLAGYWSAGNYPPDVPTLYDVPFDNEKTGSSTPYFDFSALDPDGTVSIIYEIQWDDDPDVGGSPLGDRTSDDESGCSPNCFVNTVTGGDTSPFNEGERVRFTIQTPLETGTTYYWRVRAKDGASGLFGEWSDVRSVTYVEDTDPKAWIQTEDAQFDQGTLSGVETYGLNKVRLSGTPPVGAMVAYGSNTNQSPHYRTWNGSAWSASSSAQSVGGQISWTVLRAAPTRNEYILGTQDTGGDVNVQVYDGTSGTWGDLIELTPQVGNAAYKGFDIQYRSESGDAVVAYCDGNQDPSYAVWDGANWSATSTIDLAFTQNCEWLSLAANPVSDELIMVARANVAQTNPDYEAQVLDPVSDSWGSTYSGGSGDEGAREGIAIGYEEGGNEAVIAVSNGQGNSFAYNVWNGESWAAGGTVTLGDDFEWGEIASDQGTDAMALCYIDEDNDIGTVFWNGTTNTWGTYREHDQNGDSGVADTDAHGRPVSCQYETTAGRDGYHLVAYSNTANAEYNYYTGSAWQYTIDNGASISSVEDSWTVGTTRTGDGTVLGVFHDNANTRYDFSAWDGSSWTTKTTLDDYPSRTAEPWLEPIAVAAQKYQELSGNITSSIVDFDLVPGRPSWGEVIWNTTEPAGTDVSLRVYYATTTAACNVAVPDAALPGNSTGFSATSSPLDLSSLSTSTYNMLCIKAGLSSSNANTPTLDDWSLSWERQPYLTQSAYRFYVNTASTTPSDVWPVGSEAVNESTPLAAVMAPSFGSVLRLRLAVRDTNVALGASSLTGKLQWAEGSICGEDLAWFDVGSTTANTAWRGYDNAGVSDGATLPSLLLSNADTAQSYEESNPAVANPNAIAVGNEGEWDFVLQHNATSSTNYCFRIIATDGTALSAYDTYPQLVTDAPPTKTTLNAPFDNQAVASATPAFDFVSEDVRLDDLHYQIQVDDDITFGSTLLDRNSSDNFSEFSNLVSPADKSPFNAGEAVRFIPSTGLSDGTTYWWRVRARDPNGSGEWGEWSEPQSVTRSSGVAATTWYQTTFDQFNTISLVEVEADPGNTIILTPPSTVGTATSPSIDFDWGTQGNAWGSLAWNDTETTGDIKYRIEYNNGGSWVLVPDSVLSGNAAGFDTSPVSLLSLDPTAYNELRIVAVLTDVGGSPSLNEWTLSWGYAVSQPVLESLFDNEKTATVTPSFTFHSEDPESNDLVYELQWSSDRDFVTGVTSRTSDVHAGFVNSASSTDTSPFFDGDTIRFTVQGADSLTNGSTYWWRVRARDPAPGANAWSVWSPAQSFTVDTGVVASTWFQTTDEQFETDTLTNTQVSGADSVEITSVVRDVLLVYAEGVVQTPRYRLWNGSSWGSEKSAGNIGERMYFARTAAAPTRDEYALLTGGISGAVKAQVYSGITQTWSTPVDMSTPASAVRRGFDVAYETDSGDAIAVSCRGADAVYRTWNGSSWSATSTINLVFTQNCEWIELASDPESDEIIMIARANPAEAPYDFEAQVWNGSGWGNSTTQGAMDATDVENIGMDVEYEESGGDAVFVTSNNTNANFHSRTWNGSSWSATTSVTIADDLETPKITRDVGSDGLTMCYVAATNGIYYTTWNGSAWGTPALVSADSNSKDGSHSFDCVYETVSGRDGYLMFPYTDATNGFYRFWNTATLQAETALSTVTDSWSVQAVRAGDGTVVAAFWDDANTNIDVSDWNGTAWSVKQSLETNVSALATANVPMHMSARTYPSVTSGSVVSSMIDFHDGSGPRWDAFSWNDSTPGSSDILYQVEYTSDDGETWALVPDALVPGNSTGSSTGPISLQNMPYATYDKIRVTGSFVCSGGLCPTLSDWTVSWSEGVSVSGTAKAYDETTALTTGTVAVAVNGVVQSGKTGSISAGTWSIPNVTVFPGDVVHVWIDGASDAEEAAAVFTYDGFGNATGVELIERHLSIGSDIATTTTNAQIALYDNSVSGDEDLFFDVISGSLTVCATGACTDAELYVRSGIYRPDSASGRTITTHDMEIAGTLIADANNFIVSGSWETRGTSTHSGGTVTFTATSTAETVDAGSAMSQSFSTVVFGQTSGSATWTLRGTFDVNAAMSVSYGTLIASSSQLTLGGNMTIGASGAFVKGSGTTTLDGTGTAIVTDNTAIKQDLGTVAFAGSAKTVRLGSALRVTDLTIASGNTFDVTASNHALEVVGDLRNAGTFSAQGGTVTFTATSTGRAIDPGASSFYNLTMNGVGGNWAFVPSDVSITNNLTVATGTLTLAVGTTTISGNLSNTGGTIVHNNGTVQFIGTGTRTITQGGSSLFTVVVNSSGVRTWTDTNATTSGSVRLTNGTLILPAGTHVVGGSFIVSGGTVNPNGGTVRLTTSSIATVRTNGSALYAFTMAGSGSVSLVDTNLTATGTVRFESGTTTLPTGTLTVGGSFVTSGGTFLANGGTVLFNAPATGRTVSTGGSPFSTVTFNGAAGGWTVLGNATSTGAWNITNAASFVATSGITIEVRGTFTNGSPAATVWDGATLFLNSGTGYTIGDKNQASEVYGTLAVGPNTDIRTWRSSSTAYSVDPTGSVYSQDHAGNDGSLHIYGMYERTSGTDHWSYTSDFDGADISGTPRSVAVRFASDAGARYTGGAALRMLGGANATTTIENLDTGTYALSVTDGTFDAQYFSITDTDTDGLSILGSSTVGVFSDGSFVLATENGSALTVSSTTIDANPEYQPERFEFGTSTGITAGYNVTAIGTAVSYWWFKDTTGNFDGEMYDNDPTGDPGSVRWDDSGFSITISGTVYAGEGTGGPSSICDGSTQRLKLVVSGVTEYTASCNATTGSTTFSGVSFSGDAVLTLFIDGASTYGATVSRTPQGDVSGFDLYERRVIVRHEGVAPLTIAQLQAYDADNDADVPFDAESGQVTVRPEVGLFVWGGKSFAPAGDVVLESGGSGAAYDGSLHLDEGAVFTATGTEHHRVGGSWVADTGSTFVAANSMVEFTATTSGKSITPRSNFHDVTVSGVGGVWTLGSSVTVLGDLSLAAGTVQGTNDLTVQGGTLAGNGTLAMTDGTVTLSGTGSFGGSTPWSVRNLAFGTGSGGVSTKAGTGSVTVSGTLSIATGHTLEAGSSNWILTGTGSVLSASGTFSAQTSTTTFSGTSGMNVPALTYHHLVLAPAAGGSPSYTLNSGTLNASSLTVGNGTHAVTANVNAQDPLLFVSGTVRIRSNATYNAASSNDIHIGGSYVNEGVFTANGGGVVFDSNDVGEFVTPGASAFHHLTFNNAAGGWTITGNATTTGNFSLTAASSYTQQSGSTLAVQGVFTNGVGGVATQWDGSVLKLDSGTAYTINTKTSGGDVYGTLTVGANTDIRAWNSTSSIYQVNGSGSLYSQDHNAADGDLYIWGDYVRSSGSDYWSYATDFDGTDISGSPRAVRVRLSSGATTTLTGGSLSLTGAAGATTTVRSQGGGTYGLVVSGGTFSARYYEVRDIVGTGISFSGTPTVSDLSYGDLLLQTSGGSMLTVAGSVIDANPVKLFESIVFATTTGVTGGYNVTVTGSSVSSWRFIPGSGNYYGEAYDNDPAGNPGYAVFSDSDDEVTVAGNVYSDEGSTVSAVCNGSTDVVALSINGGVPITTSCAAGTGYYEFSAVSGYAPGDTITVFLNDTSVKAVNVTQDLLTGISNMHLYEERVIIRHEDTDPMSIDGLSAYDSGDDPDILFTTTISPDTVTFAANTKLIVWDNKTFTPGGDVTLLSSGSGEAHDGTLELKANAQLVSSVGATEQFVIGGSWLTSAGAIFTAGLSEVTFTATTSGKIVSPDTSPFHTLTFDGAGGAWTFADRDATTTDDLAILSGSVTLGTSTLAVRGSFTNSGAMSAASTSIRLYSGQNETVAFGGYDIGSIIFAGTSTYSMVDTNATSTGSLTILSGNVTLPSGTLAVAHGFVRSAGTFTQTSGTLRLYGSLAAQSITLGGSTLHGLTVDGTGSWAFTDTVATTTGTTTVARGGLTAPSTRFNIGGSLLVDGTYNPNGGTTFFFATTTGRTVRAAVVFGDVTFSGIGGGWTVATSATSTGAWRLIAGSSFTMASSTTLEVQGVFENRMGTTTTDWTNSTLYLNASGTSYTVNTKTTGGDSYAYLTLGANTDVRMWDSTGATTTVHTSSSLYSMDHAGQAGDLYIYGEYARGSATDYWSYATDFDGTALGGQSRQVDVRIASSSLVSYTNGTLSMLGAAGATTTVASQGTGRYGISLNGGTLSAQYYSFNDLTSGGLTLTGAVTVSSLSYGDFELDVDGGTLITVSAATIDQNASKILQYIRFATSTGIATGTNVSVSGTTANFWDFRNHYGNFDGEAYDNDGVDACGAIRWDDSTCLEVSQTQYRFRADDGGGGAPDSEWYDTDWTKRKRVTITNGESVALSQHPVRFDVGYDGDMLSEFTDLRFTDGSGTTSIPYWVERYTTSATATVWVKVPSVPANGSTHIFAYYGNPSAENGESGADTFTFFDDFEDDSISEYSGDTAYFDVIAESGAEGSYVLKAASGYEDQQTADGIYRTGTTFSQGSTIRWMQYVDATEEDEPCTLFGVQSPGTANQNYAVCLDRYPNEKLVLTKNVSSNDGSGINPALASTTVTWSTGWYTVEVDWKTDDSMFVSVYDPSGALFATTSATDGSYTSGGVGFSFWYQRGAWDAYLVYPYVESDPTTSTGLEQGRSGATWKAAVNTSISQAQEDPFRVRFAIENSGPEITEQNWRLQYADRTGYGACAAVPDLEYLDVENAAGCGINAVCMVATDDYADGAPTEQLLGSDAYLPFTQGVLIEDPSNQSSDMTLPEGHMTEVEYAIQLTGYATADSYCMRVTNGGAELDSYANLAEVTAKYGPSITGWTLNNDEPIALVEGGTLTVYATGTVVDLNGASDILYATGTIYRSGVGPQCTDDPNNCYQINSLDCPLVDCEGNSCTIACAADMQFFADPTDPGSALEGEEWLADVFVVDSTDNVATTTSYDPGVEVDVLTMWGLAPKTGLISYGALGLGEDTGSFNATTTFQNTGNDDIDITLEGTDMTAGGGSVIPVGNQIASTTPFVYSACTICVSLSGAASPFEVDLPKPTSTVPVSDDIFWGVYVPSTGVNGATHAGLNTFYATGD